MQPTLKTHFVLYPQHVHDDWDDDDDCYVNAAHDASCGENPYDNYQVPLWRRQPYKVRVKITPIVGYGEFTYGGKYKEVAYEEKAECDTHVFTVTLKDWGEDTPYAWPVFYIDRETHAITYEPGRLNRHPLVEHEVIPVSATLEPGPCIGVDVSYEWIPYALSDVDIELLTVDLKSL